MNNEKLMADPVWTLARAVYNRDVYEKILGMADANGMVKARDVVALLADPDLNALKQHFDRFKAAQAT